MSTTTKNTLEALAFVGAIIALTLFWAALSYAIVTAARLAWGTCG